MKRLPGKVALVTGAGQGVGLGIAQAYAAEGADLVLTGRDRAKLEAVAAELKKQDVEILIVPGDVRKRASANEAVRATIARFGKLDILVNNAQSIATGPAESISDEDIAMTMESGFYGALYFMQAAFPHMKEHGGSIINLGSGQGIRSPAHYGIYAANKEALRSFSRVAAREWGQHGIRVNILCPSALTPAAQSYIDNHPEAWEQDKRSIALGHMGDPLSEIAPIAVFLASAESAYMTGQTLNVDGGVIMM